MIFNSQAPPPDYNFRNPSYSQEGEDLVLNRIFENRPTGFYVDIGAFHPFRFSNTFLFYQKGWRGINIDATPGSMAAFHAYRPRDINLEAAIGKPGDSFPYYLFNEPALNTFSSDLKDQYVQKPEYEVIQTVMITPQPLSELLNEHSPPNQRIDFMSIDAEGKDLEVLQSNDWEQYRPLVLLVEIHARSVHDILSHEIARYLNGLGYIFYAKTVFTCLFVLPALIDQVH